jgi:hypothetical protein
MFRGLLRSPRGLTLFVPTGHAAQPLMNLRFFSLTKIRQLADQTCPLSPVSSYKVREGPRTVEIDVIRYGDFF